MSTERDPLTTAATVTTDPSAPNPYAKQRATALAHAIQDGNASLRTLALLGGIAMTLTGAYGIWNRFLSFRWISAIVELYTFVLGLGVVALEARVTCLSTRRTYTHVWEGRIRKYASFLNFVSGRGGLYFVAGTLQLSQRSLADLVVGGYMALVGIAYIITGQQISQKLRHLRKSALSEDVLREKFARADTGHCGSLSMEQFKTMMSKEFGMDFSARELEASFCHVETVRERSGRVTLEEFLEWWWNCEFDDASMAEFGLSV